MLFDAFLTPEQWRKVLAEMQRSDSGFCDSKAAATIAQPLEGLEPHHVMRLAISDDDYFQTDYGAGLACGIKQPA